MLVTRSEISVEDTTGAIKEGLKYCNADEVANNKGSGYNTLAEPADWSKYGVVHAGAKKNVRPAGVTFVIARNDHVAGHRSDTYMLCDWRPTRRRQIRSRSPRLAGPST